MTNAERRRHALRWLAIGVVTATAVTILAQQPINQAAFGGTAVTLGQKAMTASIPTVLASDQASIPVAATLAAETTKVIGTVNPGNTANTTPWLVSLVPPTSGGVSNSHTVCASTTNVANIKAGAGQVYGIHAYDNVGYPVYVKLHNTAGTPTAGAGVVLTVGVQAGLRADVDFPSGYALGTGIGLSIVKDITDAGTTVTVASDCVVDIQYK